MKYYDWIQHVKGSSQFIDDITLPEGCLHAAIYYSNVAHAKIKNLILDEALNTAGVKEVITYKDIPGENQIGGIIPDETLLAENHIHYSGEPIAIVVGETIHSAREAVRKIKIVIEELEPVTDPRAAFANSNILIPPMIFSLGDVDDAWKECDFLVEGKVESGAQEHLYLETQGSIASPVEGGGVKIISSTQGPTAVQKAASRVLGISMNKIEVDVLRLGGGFGGKEDQATPFGCMAALAAFNLKKPVKLVLNRKDDLRITGKRHPYSSDYKIGLTKERKILAYEAVFYQNGGAVADLSPAILQRTMFHATNSYFIPNVKATGYSCKTNLPPFTAFRGFGGPQAMFVLESAIHKAAAALGIDASVIQEKNLLREGDEFPYGQKTKDCHAKVCWNNAVENYEFEKSKNEIAEFNSKNKYLKKGISLMPICFGISFTNTSMNQAGALVHIYKDGSVGISTAAIEMGQGVNTKMREVAGRIFGADESRIKMESTNTSRVANTSPTAASSAADLNGKAVESASNELMKRLKDFICKSNGITDNRKIEIIDEKILIEGKETGMNWEELISKVHLNRIDLSAHGFYATPGIYFDTKTSKGDAFAYHVFGTAIIEVTVDCLRGTFEIDSVKVVHDFGESIDKLVDRGQAEGAIVQGLGWMTCEEVIYNDKGILLTDTLSTYKVPDIHFAPEKLELQFLENSSNPMGIFKSKAIGEPPFMYGIGAYFAVANAMKAYNPSVEINYRAPMTHERVLLILNPVSTE
ncbi:MAG: molybdopterin cofactor-binding domain-containing protein [bacterium]